MAQKIILKPHEVWKYYIKHKADIENTMYEIASNESYGIVIYLSEDVNGVACITVNADDSEVYSESVVNDIDCQKTVSKIYDNYLTDKVIELLDALAFEEAGADESLLEQEDSIAEREEELDGLVYDFVFGVLGDSAYDYGVEFEFDDMLEDIKDHFLEYMFRKYELPIYRPMVLEDENGDDFFEEYPYESMVFDDNDNPIYKSRSSK